MVVNFIFKFIFNFSWSYNNGLPDHKSEESCKYGWYHDNRNINQNLAVKSKVGSLRNLVYRFPDKLYFIDAEEITGDNKQESPKQQDAVFPEIWIQGFQCVHRLGFGNEGSAGKFSWCKSKKLKTDWRFFIETENTNRNRSLQKNVIFARIKSSLKC